MSCYNCQLSTPQECVIAADPTGHSPSILRGHQGTGGVGEAIGQGGLLDLVLQSGLLQPVCKGLHFFLHSLHLLLLFLSFILGKGQPFLNSEGYTNIFVTAEQNTSHSNHMPSAHQAPPSTPRPPWPHSGTSSSHTHPSSGQCTHQRVQQSREPHSHDEEAAQQMESAPLPPCLTLP